MSTNVPTEPIIVTPMPPALTQTGHSHVHATQATLAMEHPVLVIRIPIFFYSFQVLILDLFLSFNFMIYTMMSNNLTSIMC